MLKLQCTTPTHNCQVSFLFHLVRESFFFLLNFFIFGGDPLSVDFWLRMTYNITIQQSTEAANITNRFCKQIINNNRIRHAAKIKNQTKRYIYI